MTQREQIKALEAEVAKLRDRVTELEAQGGAVHHHHHYPPAVPARPQPFPLSPYVQSPNTYGQGMQSADGWPGTVTVWN